MYKHIKQRMVYGKSAQPYAVAAAASSAICDTGRRVQMRLRSP